MSAISTHNELPLEAVVVAFQGGDAILLDEASQPAPHSYYRCFRLKPTAASCVGESRQVMLRDSVRILAVQEDEESRPTVNGSLQRYIIAPPRLVISYEIVSERPRPDYEELVATYEVRHDYISVVGRSFRHPTAFFMGTVSENQDYSQLSNAHFAMVKAYNLGDARQMMTINPETGGKCYYFVKADEEYLEREDKEVAALSHFPGDLRLLSEEESLWIVSRLRKKKSINIAAGRLYVRDPAIAAQRLEDAKEFKECSKMTTQKIAYWIGETGKGRTVIQIKLDYNETYALIQTPNHYKWHKGGQLAVEHDNLRLTGYVVTDDIATDHNRHYTIVTLRAEEQSNDLLKMVLDYPQKFRRTPFTIGPWNRNSEAIIDVINRKFDKFFERHWMLKLYAGRKSSPPDCDVPNRNVEFLVKGKPLDRNQLDFVRSAAVVPGWTCTQAPAGCGKTLTTAALVAYLKELKVEGGICVTGTTNASVTNAAETVRANFPDIRIVRAFSKSAQATEKERQIGLNYMALNPDQYLDDSAFENYVEVLREHLYAKRAYEETKEKSYTKRFQKFQELQRTEKLAHADFLQHYKMDVYATTVEKLLRDGGTLSNIAAKKAGCEEKFLEEYRSNTIKHLIVDDAAQLSPVQALALYCLLDNLEHIALLGDSKQLGPVTRLQEGSPVYKFLTEDELTRMCNLKSTVKKDFNCNYRCHPAITNLMLLPIYGEKMEIGVTAEERNMAADLGLLTGRKGSSVVFVQVNGREMSGVNKKEVDRLMQLLLSLLQKNVNPADIVIICNHRAQKDTVLDELHKNQRSMKADDILVTTVDSFQGKEAKIVILLTTKTSNELTEHKMQFVSDPKRATLAVSRAQHVLYVLGDFRSLAHSIFWARLFENVNFARGMIAHADGVTETNGKDKKLPTDGNWKDHTGMMLDCIPQKIRGKLKQERQEAAERKRLREEALALRQQQQEEVEAQPVPEEQQAAVVEPVILVAPRRQYTGAVSLPPGSGRQYDVVETLVLLKAHVPHHVRCSNGRCFAECPNLVETAKLVNVRGFVEEARRFFPPIARAMRTKILSSFTLSDE